MWFVCGNFDISPNCIQTGILLKVKALDEDKRPAPDDLVDVLSLKVTFGSPYTVGNDNSSAIPVGTEVVGQTNKRSV